MNPIFNRAELLLGDKTLKRFEDIKVILFGVGGVGSWCAEALIRTGVKNLTIVDNDVVCITNVNRQMQATSHNVGKVKVNELKKRLLMINPNANINAIQEVYHETTRDIYKLDEYDYILDAIDSLSSKIDLIRTALATDATFYSTMGAALKMDVSKIQTSSIWKTDNCPLAKLVRKRMRQQKIKGDFLCVWSDELLENAIEGRAGCGTGQCFCPKIVNPDGEEVSSDVWCDKKAQINGSLVHITGAFGFALAGLVIQDVCKQLAVPVEE